MLSHEITGALQFFILLPLLTSSWGHSGTENCEKYDEEYIGLIEGDAFYFVHYASLQADLCDQEFSWYKTAPRIKSVSSNRNNRIHYSGRALFLLNVSVEDAGSYSAVHRNSTGSCSEFPIKVKIFKKSQRANPDVLYGKSDEPGVNKLLECPDPVASPCHALDGSFTWYKNFTTPLKGEHEPELWITGATKQDEGIYTCVCSWEHNHRLYNSTGSRRLVVEDIIVHQQPQIISPAIPEHFVDMETLQARQEITMDEGMEREQGGSTSVGNPKSKGGGGKQRSKLSRTREGEEAAIEMTEGSDFQLNCTVLCGTNAEHSCSAHWEIDGVSGNKTETYDNSAQATFSTAILTIKQASRKHFQTKFVCVGSGFYGTEYFAITLKQRETIIPLVIGGVCSLLICVFVGAMVHFFAIELALLFRPYLPLSRHDEDEKLYDAYVVYQIQSGDKAAEDTLCLFVSKILPSVLEEKCGYRLFIHGRDDIPGEDCLELVEDRMRLSRRLMVILTPKPSSEAEITDQNSTSMHPINTVVGGFDWQVGVHHALVHRDMSVVLIQLGDTGAQGYKHLPPGLQHLIQKSAPLRWSEDTKGAAAWNSRFWKRVRYLMPARPASQCSRTAVI